MKPVLVAVGLVALVVVAARIGLLFRRCPVPVGREPSW